MKRLTRLSRAPRPSPIKGSRRAHSNSLERSNQWSDVIWVRAVASGTSVAWCGRTARRWSHQVVEGIPFDVMFAAGTDGRARPGPGRPKRARGAVGARMHREARGPRFERDAAEVDRIGPIPFAGVAHEGDFVELTDSSVRRRSGSLQIEWVRARGRRRTDGRHEAAPSLRAMTNGPERKAPPQSLARTPKNPPGVKRPAAEVVGDGFPENITRRAERPRVVGNLVTKGRRSEAHPKELRPDAGRRADRGRPIASRSCSRETPRKLRRPACRPSWSPLFASTGAGLGESPAEVFRAPIQAPEHPLAARAVLGPEGVRSASTCRRRRVWGAGSSALE